MKKVLTERGMGKTTSLLYYAHDLALKNSEDTIIFLTMLPSEISRKYLEIFGNDEVTNIYFLSANSFSINSIKGYKNPKIVIDDLDYLLKKMNVVGYSNTIGVD